MAESYMRIALPSQVARELISLGVAEETLEVRSAGDILAVAYDGATATAVVVAVAQGAGSVYRFAAKLAERVLASAEPQGDGVIRLSLKFRDGPDLEVDLPRDIEDATLTVGDLILRVTGSGS